MRKILIATFMLIVASACLGQRPNATNAKVQEVSAAGGLKAAFDAIVQKQDAAAWIGYRIPTTGKERTMCCFDSWDGYENSGRCCGGCKLESGKGNTFNGTRSDCSPPEAFKYSFVLFRVESRQLMRVRNYSADCALDFGGLPLYWIENVNPGQSVTLLTDLVLNSATARLRPSRCMMMSRPIRRLKN